MVALDRPEAGDPILQKWARDVVKALRDHRLVSNQYFDVKITNYGTILTLKKYKRKIKVTIALSGAPSRFYACRKISGNNGDDYTQIKNVEVDVFPLGYGKTTKTYAKKEENPEQQVIGETIAYANEMIDSEPIYNGNFIIAANNTTYITIEIEVDPTPPTP